MYGTVFFSRKPAPTQTSSYASSASTHSVHSQSRVKPRRGSGAAMCGYCRATFDNKELYKGHKSVCLPRKAYWINEATQIPQRML